MGLKRALGGGVATAVGAAFVLLLPSLVDTGIGFEFVAVIGGPVAIISSLVAGTIIWAGLPRGKRSGAVGGVIATALAYPLSFVFWVPLLYIFFEGDFWYSLAGGFLFPFAGALFSAPLTLPVGGACGYCYEYLQQRFNLFHDSGAGTDTNGE